MIFIENKKSLRSVSIALNAVAIFFFSLFAYSRQSWGLLIPSEAWGTLLVLGVVFFILDGTASHKGNVTIDIETVLLIVMFLIMSFYHNYDLGSLDERIKHFVIYYSLMFLYICCCRSKNDRWIRSAVHYMTIMALFYAFMTLICYVNLEFYYDKISVIFIKLGMTNGVHPSAGFTMTSTNNGLYITLGLCTICCGCFFKGNNKITISQLLTLILLLIGLLLSGKRGILFSFIIAFFISYKNYNIGRIFGRGFKLFTIAVVVIGIIYITSLLFPSILYLFEKTIRLRLGGDITNGRMILWKSAWSHYLENPWLGHGWRWFRYNNEVLYNMDVHNVYLQLLVETGIIGSIPFLSFFALSYYRAYKLSIWVRRCRKSIDDFTVFTVYIALTIQSFMLIYMVEGTALYMVECLFVYLISCATIEYYYKNIKNVSTL